MVNVGSERCNTEKFVCWFVCLCGCGCYDQCPSPDSLPARTPLSCGLVCSFHGQQPTILAGQTQEGVIDTAANEQFRGAWLSKNKHVFAVSGGLDCCIYAKLTRRQVWGGISKMNVLMADTSAITDNWFTHLYFRKNFILYAHLRVRKAKTQQTKIDDFSVCSSVYMQCFEVNDSNVASYYWLYILATNFIISQKLVTETLPLSGR